MKNSRRRPDEEVIYRAAKRSAQQIVLAIFLGFIEYILIGAIRHPTSPIGRPILEALSQAHPPSNDPAEVLTALGILATIRVAVSPGFSNEKHVHVAQLVDRWRGLIDLAVTFTAGWIYWQFLANAFVRVWSHLDHIPASSLGQNLAFLEQVLILCPVTWLLALSTNLRSSGTLDEADREQAFRIRRMSDAKDQLLQANNAATESDPSRLRWSFRHPRATLLIALSFICAYCVVCLLGISYCAASHEHLTSRHWRLILTCSIFEGVSMWFAFAALIAIGKELAGHKSDPAYSIADTILNASQAASISAVVLAMQVSSIFVEWHATHSTEIGYCATAIMTAGDSVCAIVALGIATNFARFGLGHAVDGLAKRNMDSWLHRAEKVRDSIVAERRLLESLSSAVSDESSKPPAE